MEYKWNIEAFEIEMTIRQRESENEKHRYRVSAREGDREKSVQEWLSFLFVGLPAGPFDT